VEFRSGKAPGLRGMVSEERLCVSYGPGVRRSRNVWYILGIGTREFLKLGIKVC